MPRAHHKLDSQEEVVFAKALRNAAEYWGLTNSQLGDMIGLSEASVSRLKNGQYLLERHGKPWQLAAIFLRIFRGLDAYMGGHRENENIWLRADNTALGGAPIELMRTVEGLAGVVQYIDHMRGK